ncbi:putative membrane protein [Helicobacter pylori Hp A-11]|uniref:Putative membrane protein n=1 Tax=Helicobacter pylori Hp A-11 TaxID=992035 RepID=N4TU78_HELPX|nr:putative membrane protein [Helicobacter pylori Hp A-11]
MASFKKSLKILFFDIFNSSFLCIDHLFVVFMLDDFQSL